MPTGSRSMAHSGSYLVCLGDVSLKGQCIQDVGTKAEKMDGSRRGAATPPVGWPLSHAFQMTRPSSVWAHACTRASVQPFVHIHICAHMVVLVG